MLASNKHQQCSGMRASQTSKQVRTGSKSRRGLEDKHTISRMQTQANTAQKGPKWSMHPVQGTQAYRVCRRSRRCFESRLSPAAFVLQLTPFDSKIKVLTVQITFETVVRAP
jgi:hypothetical protein